MHDNKVRLSQDVLEKAERIAAEWGLKNARAAVEAVFRKYCDDYLYGRMTVNAPNSMAMTHEAQTFGYGHAHPPLSSSGQGAENYRQDKHHSDKHHQDKDTQCEALAALDQLLAI
jgi:hypothetical protein